MTAGELESYRKAGAERWFREAEAGPEGAHGDPFEPVAGQAGHHRIRKRRDGACGFLSAEDRCRIHEELGGPAKPLTCRLFPFRFHETDAATLVTASFACPSVGVNHGTPLPERARELDRLRKAWWRAWPEPPSPVRLTPSRPLDPATLDRLRTLLRRLLDRPAADGAPDLAANLARTAAYLEDLTRYRVTRLADDAFAEYIELTGRFAAESEKPAAIRPASGVARLLFRGLLLTVEAGRLQREGGRRRGLRLGLRLRLFGLLLHLHGLAPPVAGFDLRLARRAALDWEASQVRALLTRYLQSAIETLGTGRRPVVEELSVAVALLNVAVVLATHRAARGGRDTAGGEDLAEGLLEASDVAHAAEGLLGRALGLFSGGPEALHLFAASARAAR